MFQPGHPKLPGAGRPKGSITRDRQMLLDRAKELGVDVFEILLRFAAGDWKGLGYNSPEHVIGKTQRGQDIVVERIPPELRQKSANDAAKYVLPQLKAVDVNMAERNGPIQLTVNLAGPNETSHAQPAGTNPAADKPT